MNQGFATFALCKTEEKKYLALMGWLKRGTFCPQGVFRGGNGESCKNTNFGNKIFNRG